MTRSLALRILSVLAAATLGVAVAAAPIKIGYFAPESGFAAADGASSYDAAKLAVDLINGNGGINGTPLELVNYDDGSDVKQAVAIANKLLTQDHVTAIVSGSYSDQTLAVAPIVQRAAIPMVAAYAVNPGITKAGNYIFQQSFTGTVEGRAGAYLATHDLGAKKIAIVGIDNDFGHSLVDGFKAYAQQHGATIVAEDFFQFGEKEFTPLILRDRAKGADLFYLVAYAPEGSQFVRQYKQMGLDIPVVGTEGLDSTTQFLQVVGDRADGIIITTNLDRDTQDPDRRAFIDQFTQAYGHSPDMVAASTYDAFFVLADVMRTSGTTPTAIQSGLDALKNFKAITGQIQEYNDLGQVVKPVQLQIVKNGAFHRYGVVDDPSIITP